MANTTAISGTPLLQTLFQQSDRVGNARTTSEVSISKSATANGATVNGATASGAPVNGTDKAALSTTGGALAQASVQDTDDVRTAKVQQIQGAIANGTYSVPASAVADKLIQHLLG